MHRFRSWTLDPPEWRTQRNRILAVEGGDGSTLSVDFTTGILDPRLTFTRTTNATFINSQGYVQYALANMQPNTTFDGISGTTYAVGWGGFVGTGASFERLSSGVLKCKAATSGSVANSNRAFLSTTATIPIGLPTTFKVTIQDKVVSSSLDILNFVDFVSATTSYKQYRVNGVPQTTSYNSIAIGDVITVTVIPTQSTGNFRVGLGCNVNQSLNDYVTIANVMLEHGEETKANYVFLPNSSTSLGNFNTPRFDYNPTTTPPTPRGLLIEGSATNLAVRSDDFNTTVTDGTQWTASGYTAGTLSTTLPDGTTGNARRLTMPSGSGSFRSASITVTESKAYTFSFWARNNGGSQARFRVWNVTAGSSIVDYTQSVNNYVSQIGGANNTSSTWVRVSVPFTTPAGCTAIYVYPCSSDSGTVDLLIWGAQVELGSGASSYIPTGASTVSRAADKMSMNDITSMNWNQTAGTFLLDMNVAAETNQSGFPGWFGMYTATPVRVIRSLLNNSSGTTPRIFVDSWSSTPTQILNFNTVRPASPTRTKFAFALSNSGQAIAASINGGAIATGTGTGTMQTPTRMLFHQDPSAGDSELFPVYMRALKYWPTNLPDAQLQTLTTG